MKISPKIFTAHPRLWLVIGLILGIGMAALAFLGRGPDYTIEWKRDVPSKLKLSELDPALRDLRTWPVYFHDLRQATILAADGSTPKQPLFEIPALGTQIRFEIEPRGKEWKRYTLLAKVIAYEPGKKIRFLLLEESTGKTTRLLRNIEWEVSVHGSDGKWEKKGYPSVVHGEIQGETRTSHARFLGRIADRSLMNQVYWIDLVRLANFVENQASWAGNLAPVYQ